MEETAALTESLRIDGNEQELVPIGTVAIGGGGRVFLTQPMDQAVRIFEASGSPAGSIGGQGQGPGEFSRLARLSWHADTLVAHDPGQGRLTLFSPDLTVARTLSYPTEAELRLSSGGNATFPIVIPLALRSDGEVVATLMNAVGDVPPGFEDQVLLARVAPDGEVAAVLARVQTSGMLETSEGVVVRPFPNRELSSVSPNGDWLSVANVSMGDGVGELNVSVIDTRTGDTTFAVHREIALQRIPDSVGDSVISTAVEALENRNPALAEAFREEAEVPDYYPPLAGLSTTNDGGTVVTIEVKGAEKQYLMLDPSGNFGDAFRLGDGHRLAAVDDDRIWVIEPDPLGVQSLVGYQVTARRP